MSEETLEDIVFDFPIKLTPKEIADLVQASGLECKIVIPGMSDEALKVVDSKMGQKKKRDLRDCDEMPPTSKRAKPNPREQAESCSGEVEGGQIDTIGRSLQSPHQNSQTSEEQLPMPSVITADLAKNEGSDPAKSTSEGLEKAIELPGPDELMSMEEIMRKFGIDPNITEEEVNEQWEWFLKLVTPKGSREENTHPQSGHGGPNPIPSPKPQSELPPPPAKDSHTTSNFESDETLTGGQEIAFECLPNFAREVTVYTTQVYTRPVFSTGMQLEAPSFPPLQPMASEREETVLTPTPTVIKNTK